MSERLSQPSPQSFEGFYLGDVSLRDWHTRLTTDAESGERTGHTDTPGSRYGTTSETCAYWALATGMAYIQETGDDLELLSLFDSFMGLTVNDNPDIAVIVLNCWERLPVGLRRQLGTKRDVKRMIEGEGR